MTIIYEKRLLERDPVDISKTDIPRTIGSVIKPLQRLLNTRQGNAPIAQDYGISDLTNSPEKDMTIIRQP